MTSGSSRRASNRSGFVRQTKVDIERARVAPIDAITDAYDSSNNDPAVQAGAVEQRLEHSFAD
jgi:hypothetical protein